MLMQLLLTVSIWGNDWVGISIKIGLSFYVKNMIAIVINRVKVHVFDSSVLRLILEGCKFWVIETLKFWEILRNVYSLVVVFIDYDYLFNQLLLFTLRTHSSPYMKEELCLLVIVFITSTLKRCRGGISHARWMILLFS